MITAILTVLITALVMGYPLHRVTIQRNQARALAHPSARHLRAVRGGK